MPDDDPPPVRLVVVVEVPAGRVRRLAGLLKALGRRYGIRVLEVRDAPREGEDGGR